MKSIYQKLTGKVTFPEFKGNRLLYMNKTDLSNPVLPEAFKDYLPVIEQSLATVKQRNVIGYITIDEKLLSQETHRRPGIHVDYNWFEGKGHGGGRHEKNRWDTGGGSTWKFANDEEQGGMLLVSNYAACRVYKGEFEGEIGEGGDCSNIHVAELQSELMEINTPYYINALGIHESLIVKETVKRSLVRINFHPEYKFNLQ